MMKYPAMLVCAFLAGSAFADCPLPPSGSLSEKIEAAENETHKFSYDEERLVPRLQSLGVQELAHYIADLAKGGTPSGYDQAIVLAFRVADQKGESNLLKYALDYDGDGYSVVRILAHDVDDQDIVSEILESFVPREDRSPVGIKLLSDVDDTLYPNLVDPRYKKTNTRYPGAAAFYLAIAEEPDDITAKWSGSLSIVTLSARPEIRGFDLVESSLASVSKRLDGSCTMSLGGEILSSTLGTVFTLTRQASLPNDKEFRRYEKLIGETARSSEDIDFLAEQEIRIGQVKFDNFRRFTKIYPAYDYVFVGDSGQADAYAARLIMDHNPELPGPGKAIVTFIHDLRAPGHKEYGRGMSPTKEVHDAVKQPDVILFRNHIQAALIAYRRGKAGTMKKLIDAEELVAVVEQAMEELKTAQFKSDEIGAAASVEFARDAAEAMIEAKSASAANLTLSILETVSKACGGSGANCVEF